VEITRRRRLGRKAQKAHPWVVSEYGLLPSAIPVFTPMARLLSRGDNCSRVGRWNDGLRKSERNARYSLAQVSVSERKAQSFSFPTASGPFSRLPPRKGDKEKSFGGLGREPTPYSDIATS
jgi:hypothetical protein